MYRNHGTPDPGRPDGVRSKFMETRKQSGRTISLKKLVPGLPVLGKTILAINRSSLGGLERYFAIFTTV